jgi:ELWxxDGT repeat protein
VSPFSSPANLTAVGDTLFFSAQDAAGVELWKTDGTAAGTSRVADITPGAGSTEIGQTYGFNGALYFSAAVNGGEEKLWKSDGTAAGTYQVGDLGVPRQLTGLNGYLYVVASDVAGRSVFRTDGTTAGTLRLTHPGTGDASFEAGALHAAGGQVYVVGMGGANRERFELWRTGAAPGTAFRLLELSPRVTSGGGPTGGYWSFGAYAMASNSTHLYFPAYRPEWGMEPHRMPLVEPPGGVSGTLFEDRNRNGVRNAGEPGLAGRTVFVDLDGDRVHDADEPSATTGAGGTYTVAALEVGSYTVRQVLPDGWAQTTPVNSGGRVVTVALQTAPGVDFGSADLAAPAVSVGAYDFAAGRTTVRLVFSEDVGATLTAADVQVLNLTTGAPVSPQSIQLSYDAPAVTATITFPGYGGGVLPSGNYRATIPAGAVADAAGNAMAAFALDFFVLPGDINRDRTVNGTDFALLAGNFGKSGTTYGQGDLNGDGAVNGSDFALLAGNFGKTVPPVAPAPPAPAVVDSRAVTSGAMPLAGVPSATARGRGDSLRRPAAAHGRRRARRLVEDRT